MVTEPETGQPGLVMETLKYIAHHDLRKDENGIRKHQEQKKKRKKKKIEEMTKFNETPHSMI